MTVFLDLTATVLMWDLHTDNINCNKGGSGSFKVWSTVGKMVNSFDTDLVILPCRFTAFIWLFLSWLNDSNLSCGLVSQTAHGPRHQKIDIYSQPCTWSELFQCNWKITTFWRILPARFPILKEPGVKVIMRSTLRCIRFRTCPLPLWIPFGRTSFVGKLHFFRVEVSVAKWWAEICLWLQKDPLPTAQQKLFLFMAIIMGDSSPNRSCSARCMTWHRYGMGK